MIVSITKIKLNSYLKLLSFFKFNGKILKELSQSKCKKYKISYELNLKVYYTMTLWENQNDLNEFYRNGSHLEAMKQSTEFSSKIKSKRIHSNNLINWKIAKEMFK